MKYISASEIGLVRESNQDALLTVSNDDAFLCMVCDGIGGALGGDFASQTVIGAFKEAFLACEGFTSMERIREWFDSVLRRVNRDLYRLSLSNRAYAGMGTTLSAVILCHGEALAFNIGDSRIYTYQDEKLRCLTQDQTYAYQMYLRHEIAEDEVMTHPKRHILMNAIGVSEELQYDLVYPGHEWEYLMVSSDGLHGYVNHQNLSQAFAQNGDLVLLREALLELAFAQGAYDNISFVIVKGDHRE